MQAVCLIENHIENNSQSTFMTFVDELFVHIGRTVSFVRCKIEIWIVAPTVVAVEFGDRHQFNGCNAQRFQVIELANGSLQRLFRCEVSQKHFINRHVVGICNRKVGYFPVVGRFFAL